MVLSIIRFGISNQPLSSIIIKTKMPTMVMVKAMVITNHKRYNTKSLINKIIWFISVGLERVWRQGRPVENFGQEPSFVLAFPSSIAKPCEGLVHVGCENQDWLVRFWHTVQAFYPFHGQAFLAWRIRPSRVQFTDQALMVSDLSGRLQLTHSLRM